MQRWSVGAAVGLSFALAARLGVAQPVSLHYANDAACPSASAFEGLVRARTARAEFAREAARSFEVTLERRRGTPGWAGSLRVRARGDGRESVRYLEGESCEETAAALALVVALTIDPNASTAPIVTAPAATSSPLASPPAPPPPPTRPQGLPPPSAPSLLPSAPRDADALPHENRVVRALLGADVEIATALAPTALLGGALFAELDRGDAPNSPSLRLSLALASSSFGGASPVATFLLGLARASVCPVGIRFGRRASALACADVGVGLVHATGMAVARPTDANVLWAEAGATAVFRWEASERTFVDAAVGGQVPITRPTFVFRTPLVVVHEVPPLGAVASLAVGVRFR